MNTPLNFPGSAPINGPDGRMSPAWWQFFVGILSRTGGEQGVDLPAIIASLNKLSADLKSVEAEEEAAPHAGAFVAGILAAIEGIGAQLAQGAAASAERQDERGETGEGAAVAALVSRIEHLESQLAAVLGAVPAARLDDVEAMTGAGATVQMTAPTQPTIDYSDSIANTQFFWDAYLGQAGLTAPTAPGTAAVGSSTSFARQDHVHPTDPTLGTMATQNASAVAITGGSGAFSSLLCAANTFIGNVVSVLNVTAGRIFLCVRGSTGAGALELSSAAADADATLAGIVQFSDTNGAGGEKRLALIQGFTSGATANNRGGALTFATKTNGSSVAEAARFSNDQKFLIGSTTVDGSTNKLQVNSGISITPATTTTAPTAGAAGALPATPTGYATFRIGGTDRKIAYY